jgi:aspartokinase-like uncharacterized kinase
MWVIKIGGSLAFSPELSDWLRCITDGGRECGLALVPGGGPYADQVRHAQRRWRFDDASAHRLAVLAMEQYAQLLHVLEPSLILARSIDEIRRIVGDRKTALWLPARDCLTASDIPQSWDVTADSLSLWLARKLDAEYLFMVKSGAPKHGECDSSALARTGFVDRYFRVLLRDAPCVVCWFSKEESGKFARIAQLAHEGKLPMHVEQERRVIRYSSS